MANLTKKQISNRINWLDDRMQAFENGYGEHLWKEFNEKMEQGLYPGLVFPVVSVLFGDGSEKLGKEFHKFITDNMEKASIANKFSIDRELTSYTKFSKTMVWFANQYLIDIFDSSDNNTQSFMKKELMSLIK
jgi:hypothetical protein